jgi:3-oxoadipate enol-lactonase
VTDMHTTVNGIKLNYRLEGAGPGVIFSHALGSTLTLWDAQADALASRYHVLRYDSRGHGHSAVTPGPYSLTQLAEDVGGLCDALEMPAMHFVGLSLGGMVGMTLALARPDRVKSLVLCDTTAHYAASSQSMWAERIRIAESVGLEPLVERMMEVWFTEGFRREHHAAVERVRNMIRATKVPGYVGAVHALVNGDLREQISRIRCPVMVLVGAEDHGAPVATGPKRGLDNARFMHEQISGSELVVLADAAHCPPVEVAAEFSRVVGDFLDRVEGASRRKSSSARSSNKS